MSTFVRHESCEKCGSSDGKAVYDDSSSHCFVCTHTVPSQEYKEGAKPRLSKVRASSFSKRNTFTEDEIKEKKLSKDLITNAEHEELKGRTELRGNGYRGISDEVLKFYGCRTEYDSDGDVEARYYPYTIDSKIAGYKCRTHPKIFGGNIGNTGKDCDLYGRFRFNTGKYCVPMDTKALTRNGWKGYEEIQEGDYVLGFDSETRTKRWTKVLAKHKRSDLSVIEFGAGKQRLRSTLNHRWYVDQRTTLSDKSKKVSNLEVRTLEQFTQATGLIVNAPMIEDISVGVSDLSNSKYEIDWFDRVINMTHEQRITFLDGALIADGCYHDNSYWSLSQNDGPLFESMLLAAYLVHPNMVRVKKQKPNKGGNVQKHIVLSNSKHRTRLTVNQVDLGIQDTWCITTELDSWVIRQGDFITITGNCLVVEGEEDAHAAYQMFLDYSRSKNSEFVTAVVSLGQGAASVKQIANNYEFLSGFEHIVLGVDNDTAGEEALEKLIPALPKGKVKIAKWTKHKDPNAYLEADDGKRFISDFYNAQSYVPAGVVGSDKIYDRIKQFTAMDRLPFPPIMKELNDMFNGGLTLKHIVNIAADTGIGKTSLVNEVIYHWIFHSPYKIGIVSMELDVAQYGEALFSRHISRKLALMPDEEKMQFLNSEKAQAQADILFQTESGDPRFFLCEDRDGSVEQLQEVIEQMIISSGCRVIVLDPLQDVLDGLSNDEQAVFMKWAKSMIKSHGVLFIFINHKRKSQANTPGGMNESDIHGSSTIIKSASVNILLSRDKQAEDDIVRNTTAIVVSKNRMCGLTGPAGELYYDNYSHTLHNKAEYFAET